MTSLRKTNSCAAAILQESRAAAILQEPHVIPIHDWGEINGNLYIDMRLVHGQTLYDLLKNGPMESKRALAIIQREKSWSARVEGQTTVSA